MRTKAFQTALLSILVSAVLLGAYLGVVRHRLEQRDRTVELVVDLNDLKKAAAFEKVPLSPLLDKLKKMGISRLGVFEETLPDAGALGELYYAKGSGILRLRGQGPLFAFLAEKGKIKAEKTYIYVPRREVRKRISNQLQWALGKNEVRFITREVMEVSEAEEEIRSLGLGISEIQRNFLAAHGFNVVPRLWNDPHYHLGNIEAKISALRDYETLIFDGDEIIGYPDALPALAQAMRKFKLKYGYLEIVKQDGDRALKEKTAVVRVHSVPRDELKKITENEAIDRFVRAAKERRVRLIYIRPFLPPQIDAYPAAYNLKYLGALKTRLENAGFVLGKADGAVAENFRPRGWQIGLLGAGVLAGGLLLLSALLTSPLWFQFLLFFAGLCAIALAGVAGQTLALQKLLAFCAALIFPSYGMLDAFSAPVPPGSKEAKAVFLVFAKVMGMTGMGILLMIGLLADYRFMNGVETFPAVKLALTLPLLMVAGGLIFKSEGGGLSERLRNYLEMKVSLWMVLAGLFAVAAMGILVARSGNFSLPVPGAEKYFRSWLEMILMVRPRTKEFLIGYPFLYLAAGYGLRSRKTWLWLLAAVGVIAPVSVFNSFSHIHTPLLISLARTVNGLLLGTLIGWLAWLAVKRFLSSEKEEA